MWVWHEREMYLVGSYVWILASRLVALFCTDVKPGGKWSLPGGHWCCRAWILVDECKWLLISLATVPSLPQWPLSSKCELKQTFLPRVACFLAFCQGDENISKTTCSKQCWKHSEEKAKTHWAPCQEFLLGLIFFFGFAVLLLLIF